MPFISKKKKNPPFNRLQRVPRIEKTRSRGTITSFFSIFALESPHIFQDCNLQKSEQRAALLAKPPD